jgi:hypothetical protein
MSEQNGKPSRHPNGSNSDASLRKVDSLSCKVGEELRKLLAQIKDCRKACQHTTQLVGDVNDAIKQQ